MMQEMASRGKGSSDERQATLRERNPLKIITNMTLALEDRIVANIPVAFTHHELPPDLKDVRHSMRHSLHKVNAEGWQRMSDWSPEWLKSVGDFLHRHMRIPSFLHIKSLVKHATRRQENTRTLKDQVEYDEHTSQLFAAMADVDPYPVRFLYCISVVQIIVFICAMTLGTIAPFGIGTQTDYYTVPYFASLDIQQTVSTPQNMWYGPVVQTLVNYGAKYPACMRKEDTFVDNRNAATTWDANLGCCIYVTSQRNTCGMMTHADCQIAVLAAGHGNFSTGRCSALPLGYCDEIVLHPCCFYVENQCNVTSAEHCAILPGSTFHSTAELCGDVRCEEDSCGMYSLASSDGHTPNQFWRFFTPLFIHVGIIHILSNLLALIVIGGDIEMLSGPYSTAAIYFLSGIGGYIVAALFSPTEISAGSSPCVYGFCGVQIVDLIQSWPIVDHKAFQVFRMLLSTVIILMVGTLPWIDNWAHIGGFVVGIASGFAFLPHLTFGEKDRVSKALLSIEFRVLLLLAFIGLILAFYLTNNTNFCWWCKYVNCVPYSSDLCNYT